MNCQELNEIEGLKFMPVRDNKMPIIKGWQTLEIKHDLANCAGVGLVCGKLSGGLEVIDIDCKYDLTGLLYENYKKLIHKANDKLLTKIAVQKTRGGGYHFIYRCNVVAGNSKLARRSTTEEEKRQTYDETYKAEILNGDDAEAVKKAKKASVNDKVRVLLETRGEGGFIMCYPSKGYEFLNRDFYGISEITEEERDVLFTIARQFNEVVEEYIAPKTTIQFKKTKGISSFEDYNERGDVVSLLENNGWKIVGRKSQKTIFIRPGQTTSQSSGNYDHSKKWFSVFTTSTEFEPEHAYLPYAVYAVLECNKNFSEASKKLYESGYGDREESLVKEKAPSTRVIPSRVSSEDDDYSFLAVPDDYNGYIDQVVDGTLQQGLTTGMPTLDKYFLYKEGELVMTNGHDGSGKSIVTWYLLLVAAMYHEWHSIIFSSENTLGAFMRKMIQFYWGKPLRGDNAMSKSERQIAQTFIEKYFSLIKTEEMMFNYKDIVNMVKKASKLKKYHVALIDPYNSLKTDLSGFSKLSTHDYHYEALSDIKLYGKTSGMGFWINNHAVTASLRAKDGEKRYPVAPDKADTEGGGKFGNKSDTFITVHRIAQHPSEWMVTELHVRKVKDYETGGRPSPKDSPIKLEMYKNQCAFIERLDEGQYGIDPIEKWRAQNGMQQVIPLSERTVEKNFNTNSWTPYKDDNGDEVEF